MARSNFHQLWDAALSLWGIHMLIAGWFALGFAILCLAIGGFAICYMFHLGGKWLEHQEPTTEQKAIQELRGDIQQLRNDIQELTTDIRRWMIIRTVSSRALHRRGQ